MSTKKPNKALNPTLEMTPIGALQAAFFVSSLRCAEASKPVSLPIPSQQYPTHLELPEAFTTLPLLQR